MKILFKCTSSNSDVLKCRYAIVTLDVDARRDILAKRELHQLVRSRDAGLFTMSFWDMPGDFYDSLDEDELGDLLTDEQQQQFETNEYLVLPEAMAETASVYSEFFEALETSRTECDQLVVADGGIWWQAIAKHTDVHVETARLPYEVLLLCTPE